MLCSNSIMNVCVCYIHSPGSLLLSVYLSPGRRHGHGRRGFDFDGSDSTGTGTGTGSGSGRLITCR